MVSSRTLTALVGLLLSILVSVAVYLYTNSLFVFLFVPFVPFLFRGLATETGPDHTPERRACPQCDYRTRNPENEYCPRDGTRLERLEP